MGKNNLQNNRFCSIYAMLAGHDMLKKAKAILVILNDKGLHTRPSTELVKCAGRFNAKITLSYRNLAVNAKSLLGILMLAAERGAKIAITAEGSDAEAAVETLVKLAQNRFNIKF